MPTVSESLSRKGDAAYRLFAVTLGLAVATLAASVRTNSRRGAARSRAHSVAFPADSLAVPRLAST